jgi:phospholipase D1/2
VKYWSLFQISDFHSGSYIQKAEEISGVKFLQAQVALAKQWVGDTPTGGQKHEQKTAAIKVPQPSTEGVTQSQESQKIEEVPLPATEAEAKDIIARFEAGAKQLRGDDQVADNIGQHAMLDKTNLMDEQWLGTEQEERDS